MQTEVCIVDDNTDYQFLLFKLLKELEKPYTLRFFNNAKALQQRLLQGSPGSSLPALIILDLNMPGMNGLQLLRALRNMQDYPAVYHVPVVMMGNDFSRRQMEQCYQAGANAVVIKPMDYESLRRTVQAICRFWLDDRDGQRVTGRNVHHVKAAGLLIFSFQVQYQNDNQCNGERNNRNKHNLIG